MAASSSITIYCTPTCLYCEQAKAYMKEHGFEFAEVDVAADRAGLREMVLMTGQRAVPVIRVGEKAMVGWHPAEFRKLVSRAV